MLRIRIICKQRDRRWANWQWFSNLWDQFTFQKILDYVEIVGNEGIFHSVEDTLNFTLSKRNKILKVSNGLSRLTKQSKNMKT